MKDVIFKQLCLQDYKNLPWSKPEEHDRVKFVDIRDGDDWKHEEEEEVPKNVVCGEETKFGNLAKVFSSRLG